MLKILFIGDVNGKIGRKTVTKILPKLKKSSKIDFVIANAENCAHGSGVNESGLKEMMEAGVDYFTAGDHSFDKLSQTDCFKKMPIIRPANYPAGVPGKGFNIFKIGKHEILLINLIGRVFMKKDYDCPFRKMDEILAKQSLAGKKISAIIVDIHAEATSEKICLGHYANGRVSAVLGTHTHVMTADAEIKDKGTAYITDVGMVGAADQCIGVDKENITKTFLTQISYPHVIPEKGKTIFNAVLLTIDPKTGKTVNIKPVIKFAQIK